jgi:hypothetical protein
MLALLCIYMLINGRQHKHLSMLPYPAWHHLYYTIRHIRWSRTVSVLYLSHRHFIQWRDEESRVSVCKQNPIVMVVQYYILRLSSLIASVWMVTVVMWLGLITTSRPSWFWRCTMARSFNFSSRWVGNPYTWAYSSHLISSHPRAPWIWMFEYNATLLILMHNHALASSARNSFIHSFINNKYSAVQCNAVQYSTIIIRYWYYSCSRIE